MTGFDSKRDMAQYKMNDDAQSYIAQYEQALLITYQQGFADGKRAAQPEQEPTPWRDMVVATLVREGINKHKARELADHFAAQPEQVVDCPRCGHVCSQRPWQGLTDEDKKKIATAAGCTEDDDGHIVTEIFRLAEAKLKERNT